MSANKIAFLEAPLIETGGDEDSEHSDSSSSSSDSDDDKVEADAEVENLRTTSSGMAGMEQFQAPKTTTAPGSQASAKKEADGQRQSKAALGRWAKAGHAVRTQVRIKLTFGRMAMASTKKLRMMAEADQSHYVAKLFMICVLLNIADTESKAVAFHISAVGKYSVDGKPYKFSYSLFVALLVFLMKLGLGPLERFMHKREKAATKAYEKANPESRGVLERQNSRSNKSPKLKKRKPGTDQPSLDTMGPAMSVIDKNAPFHNQLMKKTKNTLRQMRNKGLCAGIAEMVTKGGASGGESAQMPCHKQVAAALMPWIVLVAFTFCEMLSVSTANYALNVTPTSIFIVFKSGKIIFVAIASRLAFGSKLQVSQWIALFLMLVALCIATVAESKGGKKGGAMSLQGPILLILSEFFYSLMLILQQVAVEHYWPSPMLLVSASAMLGIPTTVLSMIAAHKMTSPLPPHHPVSDWQDVFIMCWNSPVLAFALVGHLCFRVGLDAYHISSAKHLSPLARAMTDVVKLAVMWVMGKSFWFLGWLIFKSDWPKGGGVLLPVLSEPWGPNSWMMIPGIMLISYAMLIFKFKTFAPLRLVKDEEGKRHWELAEEAMQTSKEGFEDTGLDDTFYSAAFTNRKVRKNLKKTLGTILDSKRRAVPVLTTKDPKNKIQSAFLKLRQSQGQVQEELPISERNLTAPPADKDAIKLNTRVKALQGKEFSNFGKEYYREGDQGSVTNLRGFDAEGSRFQVTWDRTGEVSIMAYSEWDAWLNIVGKS